MEAERLTKGLRVLHAEVLIQKLVGISFGLIEGMLQAATVDSSALPAEWLLAASTSGRAEYDFWNDKRKRRQAWSLPPGSLYVVNPPNKGNFLYNELEHGRKIEENVSIDGMHSVSTCFEQGRLGEDKSIWMSTTHTLDARNMLSTHYVNKFKGGEEFTCNSSHGIVPASSLSTCFHTASVEDPTLEVDLEQEKETTKMSQNFLANLKTGERLLRLQFKKDTKDNVALCSTYKSNLRGQHSVRLESAMPLSGSGNISKSFTTDFQHSHEICVKAQQRIGERNNLKATLITDFNQNNKICVEVKHVVQGTRVVVLNISSNMNGSTQFNVTASHTRQPTCWEWTYRRASGEANSLAVEWKREVGADQFILVRTSATHWTYNVYAELRWPF